MVNEKVLVRDKHKTTKKILKFFLIILIILVLIAIIFMIGFSTKQIKSSNNKIILENPLKEIVFTNTNVEGKVDKQATIDQGIIDFNMDYINYLLIALKVNNLHKSFLGYGYPIIELRIDNEVWNTKIIDNFPDTEKKSAETKDILITITKKEAVEALLSQDITVFMKNSVTNGNTQIEMVASKIELGSKGYLSMYKDITGEEITIKK